MKDRLVWREVLVLLALIAIGVTEPERREARQDVQLGEEQLGQAVHPRRVPQEDSVEPPAPPRSSRGRAELVPPLAHVPAGLPSFLGGEGTRPDARYVGLRHSDDPVHLLRPEPGSHQRSAGDRVRGGDERIGAVVQIQERPLGALQQDPPALAQRPVQEAAGVGDVRSESFAVREVLL
jgi:hypothetical protein